MPDENDIVNETEETPDAPELEDAPEEATPEVAAPQTATPDTAAPEAEGDS